VANPDVESDAELQRLADNSTAGSPLAICWRVSKPPRASRKCVV